MIVRVKRKRRANPSLPFRYRLVARRPGLMDQTWTSFTSELVPDAWLGTIAFALLAPPFLVLCAGFSPFETERVTFKDAYILAIGAFAVQGEQRRQELELWCSNINAMCPLFWREDQFYTYQFFSF